MYKSSPTTSIGKVVLNDDGPSGALATKETPTSAETSNNNKQEMGYKHAVKISVRLCRLCRAHACQLAVVAHQENKDVLERPHQMSKH